MEQPVWTPTRRDYARAPEPGPVGAWVPLDGRGPRELLAWLAPAARPFLLESARPEPGLARWSFLGGDPALTLRAEGAHTFLHRREGGTASWAGPLLAAVRDCLALWRTPRPEGFPPFFGGFVGMVSYDMARRFERLPAWAEDDLGLPDLDLSFADRVVAVDHETARLWVTWVPSPEARAVMGREALYDLGRARIGEALARLARPAPTSDPAAPAEVGEITSATGRDRFLDMVARAKRYIAAGDIFQANLSQRFEAELRGVSPWRLYRALSAVNPSPFAAYLDHGGYQVVSSSPERLVSLQDGRVQARPIAGTRPRGAGPTGDEANRAELLASPKERAEHLMLVDLMRNDLGRVCDYGSVRVSEFMTVERYSHVLHIVSNVVGRLGPGKDAVSLLRAVFPGGTITGAPKVRCMEIIEELEPVRRGVYTGSAGYLSVAGDMDLNILIRTLLVKDGRAWFQTGAGIVADSDPAAEYDETLHKAAAMRRALEAVARAGAVPAAAGAGA